MKPVVQVRLLSGVTALLTFLAVLQLRKVLIAAEVMGVRAWQIGVTLAEILMTGSVLVLCTIAVSGMAYPLFKKIQQLGQWFSDRKKFIPTFLLLELVFLVFITMGKYYRYQTGYFVQGLMIWCAALFASFLLKAAWPKRSVLFWLAAALVSIGFILQVAVVFSQVTDYPFSQTWSEGMQITNGAQVFSKKIWGKDVGFPVINQTHAILQSFSFLLPGNQLLWVHRLWNSLLWVGLPLGMTWTLARRLGIHPPLEIVIFSLFGYLYLTQAPLFFNLALIPLIILRWFNPDRFGRSLAIVIIASILGGASRLNWYPFAGLLAAFLFFLEKPFDGKPVRYFGRPMVWSLAGIAVAFLTNHLLRLFMGEALNTNTSYLSSALLWYRLLPSSTNSIGILLGVVITSCGLVGWLIWKISKQRGLHGWRAAGILFILFIFLLGGLVVSVKIGGGNNLHNLDGFMVLLLILAAYSFYNRIPLDKEQGPLTKAPLGLMALIVCLPLVYQIPFVPYRPVATPASILSMEEDLGSLIEQSQSGGKPVLFVSNQQMLAINRFPGILPVPKYEVVNIMEMAMTENQEYFTEFHQRLANHEWGLIIVDSVTAEIVKRDKSFGEEQNAWANWVSMPLLRYYQVVVDDRFIGIVLLTPQE